jgi:hypothetical protein
VGNSPVPPKPRCDFFSDTDPAALEVFIELQRKMEPWQKLAMVFGSIRMTSALTEALIRQEHPEASDREVFLRVAARHLDRDLMIKAYGWDPEAHA